MVDNTQILSVSPFLDALRAITEDSQSQCIFGLFALDSKTREVIVAENYEVYVVRTAVVRDVEQLPRGANAISVDADAKGHVLFREPIQSDVIEFGHSKCMSVAKDVLNEAAKLAEDYRVETVMPLLSTN
jgi:hypothetical protein